MTIEDRLRKALKAAGTVQRWMSLAGIEEHKEGNTDRARAYHLLSTKAVQLRTEIQRVVDDRIQEDG